MQEHMQDGGYERLGRKKLGLVDVVAQSVGFMGPVFSAAFIIPAIIGVEGANATGKGAGTAAPLAVLVAGIGVFALGWIVAQYAKRIHAAGALYDYVTNGLGRTIGSATGWLYYGGTIILTTGLGVLIGGYVHDFVMPTLGIDDGLLPIWVWNVIWAVVLFFVLYLGVQISTRVQLILALVSMAVVLAFFIKIIVDVGGDNDVATTFNPNSSPDGWSGILFGILYGVLIFVGFETAANLAEESHEPKRHIPRAVLFSVVVVSLFYLVASYAMVAGFGFDLGAISEGFAAAPSLLLVLSDPTAFGSDLIAKAIVVVVLLDILAVGVGAAVASTRGVFAMARDRKLPSMAASVSSHDTPIGAIVLLMIVQGAWIIANEASDTFLQLGPLPHYFSIFIWCATFGGFALLVVYLLMSLGALRGLSDHPKQASLWISAILGIAATGGGIFGSLYKVTSPTLLAPWSALIWFGLGLLLMLVVRGREPASRALSDLHSEAVV